MTMKKESKENMDEARVALFPQERRREVF